MAMRCRLSIVAAFLATLLAVSSVVAAPVYLNTPDGEQRLIGAKLRQHFFAVQPYVETQQNLAFCGPASIVAVMNSFDTPRPFEPRLYPYRFYTQDNIFNADTQRVKSFIMVSVRGMTLAEMAAFFNALGVRATAYYANRLDIDQLRTLLKDTLARPNARIVANFNRKLLTQEGGGHQSPLAAYDEVSDSVLMLDVAKFKYPPAWINIGELLEAMQSVDPDSGKSRGLVIVEK
ncbi:Phytochelatin synthase, bacterial type [Georgfuchsia toluolica]|uniref:glutathione gamma-glutamylcysteinyltransferase n=1 Tax=Georgfuchsia toluolica TaxID=424218 RepID=A0A916N917_9PROT|nr:phytochelatin synthase family protein [Georgfuchsia toluolica]CAG4883947.1 Phytochelatin synthase, bacterial type [Georgfuchsia toluolica]